MKRDGSDISFGGRKKGRIVSGWKFRVISFFIGLNVVWLALIKYKNPWRAFKAAFRVIETRENFKTNHPKIVKGPDNKYYMNLYTPGWPSEAFDRSIRHAFNVFSSNLQISLFSIVFAITHKCGFRCEHCVEWNQLNSKDLLSATDLVQIIRRFQQLGVSQIQISGGEPMNRLEDILVILDSIPNGIDFWLYTNGYNLTAQKAERLKNHGLKGVIISLDDYDGERHDRFRGVRGSFSAAIESARNVVNSGLMLAFSCCATNNFVSVRNLITYVKLCRNAGASFIQFLEPEAVGRYQNKQVDLTEINKIRIEQLFRRANFHPSDREYPIISYPAMVKRQNGCPGRGLHYLYVDADGDVHPCPFCRQKMFSAFESDLEAKVRSLRNAGCPMSGSSVCSRVSAGAISTVPADPVDEDKRREFESRMNIPAR